MYTHSPAAYEALKGFDILKLPSVSSLKAFTGSNLEAPGDIQKRLSQSYDDYQTLIQTKKEQGGKLPLGDGVLIFDEVKVAMKISWNSRNEALVGLTMTSSEMQTLQDVYESIDADNRTQKTASFRFPLFTKLHSQHFGAPKVFVLSNSSLCGAALCKGAPCQHMVVACTGIQ